MHWSLSRFPLFPYTTLFRSLKCDGPGTVHRIAPDRLSLQPPVVDSTLHKPGGWRESRSGAILRSEEHTSELQSPCNLVCRLLLEKKKKTKHDYNTNMRQSKP